MSILHCNKSWIDEVYKAASFTTSCGRWSANHQQKLNEVTSKQDTGLQSCAIFIATQTCKLQVQTWTSAKAGALIHLLYWLSARKISTQTLHLQPLCSFLWKLEKRGSFFALSQRRKIQDPHDFCSKWAQDCVEVPSKGGVMQLATKGKNWGKMSHAERTHSISENWGFFFKQRLSTCSQINLHIHEGYHLLSKMKLVVLGNLNSVQNAKFHAEFYKLRITATVAA